MAAVTKANSSNTQLNQQPKPTSNTASANNPASDSNTQPDNLNDAAASKPQPKPKKKASCKRGRKSSKETVTRARTSVHGHAGTKLRTAIDIEVETNSRKIAKALVDKTIAGNIGSARLIVDITDAMNPPAPPKKRRVPSMTQLLRDDPEYQDPPEGDIDVGYGGPEPIFRATPHQ